MADLGTNAFLSAEAERQGVDDTIMSRNLEVADSMMSSLFPQQRTVITDPHKNKSAICPRRSGKSWTAMSYASITCLSRKNARVVIVTLTLKSAKNIYWFELKNYVDRFGLAGDVSFYINDLRIDFPQGSQIMMIGAESKAQIEKLRGGKYDLVIIDEAKSYPPMVLNELIDDVVEPALMDRDGTMLMIGTPGNILSGPFFEATFPGHKNEDGHLTSRTYSDPEPYWRSHPEDDDWEWSRHEWSLKDNITTPDSWARALRRKKRKRWTDDTPTWQREYLGKWVASELAFVYAYANLLHTEPDKVTWEPDFENGNQFGLSIDDEWHYILGLDLGWEDDFAAVLGAYNPHDGTLYQVWEYKDNHQDVDAVALHIMRAIDIAGGKVDKIVGDAGGLGKMVIETLNKRHGLNIEAAEKREKNDFIELLNTDYHSGRVKLMRGSDLCTENQALQWDLGDSSKKMLARTGKLREHPSCPNHLCDAWLYLWRFSYHYWANDRDPYYEEGSVEWNEQVKRQSIAALVAEREEKLSSTFWDEMKRESVNPLKDLERWN